MVAALGNLEIGIVFRRQPHAGIVFGNQRTERIGLRRHDIVHGVHHGVVLVCAGDGRDIGKASADQVGLAAHAAGDDDLAVFGQGLADGVEALFLGAVEEAARIDDDDIGAGIVGGRGIAFALQARQDALGIDQGLGTAEGNEANTRCGFTHKTLAYDGRIGVIAPP